MPEGVEMPAPVNAVGTGGGAKQAGRLLQGGSWSPRLPRVGARSGELEFGGDVRGELADLITHQCVRVKQDKWGAILGRLVGLLGRRRDEPSQIDPQVGGHLLPRDLETRALAV